MYCKVLYFFLKSKCLPQLHTMEDMVDMVDTDTVDTPTASKHLISNILPSYISPTFNLESFTKIQDNMF